MTSNGERDFPPPFLRRCLRLKMPNPSPEELKEIVTSHFDEQATQQAETLSVANARYNNRVKLAGIAT
jgi:MoxR-like ATPase